MADQPLIPYGSPTDSGLTGGLAGILAATVFGGPIGAAIGIGTGLMSERMRRNDIDILADSYKATQEYGSNIQNSIQATAPYVAQFDPAQSEHLSSIAQEAAAAQQLSQHYDPAIRQQGLTQLANASARFDALHEDVAKRTNDQADKQYALEQETGKAYKESFDAVQTKVRDATSLADEAMTLVNKDHDIEKPETKAILMQVLNSGPRDVNQDTTSASIGFLGTGFSKEFGTFAPSYDDAVKIIEAFRSTQIKSNSDFLQQLVQKAESQGYHFSANDNGSVDVKSINSVVQNFRGVQPTTQPAGTPAPTPAPGTSTPSPAAAAVGKAVGTTGAGATQLIPAIGFDPRTIGSDASKGVDAIQAFGAESLKAAAQFIHEHTNRTKRRPTNQ